MKVKVKKLHEKAVIPKYAKQGDAGLDLVAVDCSFDNDIITYKTGLAFEIPEGHVGLLFPRSSVFKYPLRLTNSVGVVDSGYRGEVQLKYAMNNKFETKVYSVGEKVGQMIILPFPIIELIESEELSESERGENGYGHTGK